MRDGANIKPTKQKKMLYITDDDGNNNDNIIDELYLSRSPFDNRRAKKSSTIVLVLDVHLTAN